MDKADHEESFLVPNMEDIFNCDFPLNLSFKFRVDNQENMLTLENQEQKPEVKKWMRTPIKHYNKLFEIYGTDRTTGKHAESAKKK
ncbi:hypothetical protein Ahy_B05g074866 [Arachis hypogaea]|uniref:Uncharacterized protein n=1 Tax=Arachis hypogaea TaxID=3818 RepID=A0A444Z0C7_ARAHY|nr:hypothetical protein Ahy_B05g074866 [Arachis hypogaea]